MTLRRLEQTSILIPDGEEGFLARVLDCLSREANLEIHVLSQRTNQVHKHSRHIKSFTSCSPELSDDELVGVIKNLCTDKGIHLLFPIHYRMMTFVLNHKQQLASAVGLPLLPPLESLKTVTDKIKFSKHLNAEKISGPHAQVLTTPFDLGDLEIPFPILFKPHLEDESGAGRGIVLIENPEHLKLLTEGEEDVPKTFLIQEYVEGVDVDCSVLCKDGEILQYTIQTGILPGRSKFSPYSGVRLITDDEALFAVRKLMRSLNWSGVAHIDLRFDRKQQEYKVIEVNGRYWASVLASLYGGVNFPSLSIRAALDEKIQEVKYSKNEYYNLEGVLKKVRKNPLAIFNVAMLWKATPLKFVFYDPIPWIISLKRRL